MIIVSRTKYIGIISFC